MQDVVFTPDVHLPATRHTGVAAGVGVGGS